MRCSDCSADIKPVIAFDIDGTMADYHSHFLEFAYKYLGWAPGPFDYDGASNFKRWCMRTLSISEETWHDIKLAYRQGAQKRSAPATPAVVLPRAARESGAEVWLTTTRPYLRLDGIDPDTRFWLGRYEIPYDGLIYGEDKYGLLAKRIDPERVVAVLEDLYWMYDRAAELFGGAVPILWKTKYNRAVERPNQVEGLWAAGRALDNRMETWNESTRTRG